MNESRPVGRPRSANPVLRKVDWQARAKDKFLRAAAALTEPCTAEHLAFALEEGALGLHYLAKADENQRGLARLEARIEVLLKRAKKDDV